MHWNGASDRLQKESGSNAKASVSLNRETGEYKIYEEKTVVDEIHEDSENAINEITVEEGKEDRPQL